MRKISNRMFNVNADICLIGSVVGIRGDALQSWSFRNGHLVSSAGGQGKATRCDGPLASALEIKIMDTPWLNCFRSFSSQSTIWFHLYYFRLWEHRQPRYVSLHVYCNFHRNHNPWKSLKTASTEVILKIAINNRCTFFTYMTCQKQRTAQNHKHSMCRYCFVQPLTPLRTTEQTPNIDLIA